jgi:hypothetical protein
MKNTATNIPKRDCHMIGNIRLESSVLASLSFYTNDKRYSSEKFLLCCSDFCQFTIRIVFSVPPKSTDFFNIITTKYLFNKEDLNLLSPNVPIIDTNVVYYDGFPLPKDATIYKPVYSGISYEIRKD